MVTQGGGASKIACQTNLLRVKLLRYNQMSKEENNPARVFVAPIQVASLINGGEVVDDKNGEKEATLSGGVEVFDDKSVLEVIPKISSSQIFALLGGLAFGGALIAYFFLSHRPWPLPSDILPELAESPQYEGTRREAFVLKRGDFTWDILPVGTIEISGLVLSSKVPNPWTTVAEPGRTSLVTADVTKTWGNNALMGYYRRGQFGNTSESKFAHNTLPSWDGSNHRYFVLLTEKPEIDKAIRQIRPGDQCYIRGLIVQYQAEGKDLGAKKNYQIIFVEDFKFLQKHNHLLRLMVSSLVLTGSALLVLALFNKIFPPQEDHG